MAKRRRFTAGFEARVALEALREGEAVQSIGTRHQLRPDQVSRWKRKAREGLVDVFEEGPDGGARTRGSCGRSPRISGS